MIASQIRTLRIIYAAMFVSLGIYTAVSFAILDAGGPGDLGAGAPEIDMIQWAFLAVGLVVTAMSFILPGLVIRTPRSEGLPFQQVFIKKILQWALSEAVALFGLVLFFMSGDMEYILIFGAWSAALLLVHGPWGLAGGR